VNNEIMTTNQNGSVTVTAVDIYGLATSYTFNIQTVVGFGYNVINCREYLSQFSAQDAGVTGQNYTYLWDFGDGKTDSLKNVQHAFSTYGTYHVKLEIKSAMCTSNYEKTISFEPLPKLSLGNTIKLCLGDSVVQRITNAVTHIWSDGSTEDNFLIKEKGDYSVICTSGDGCLDTLRFVVTCDLFNYTITADKEEITLDNTPLHLNSDYYEFSKYYWDFGDGSKAEGLEVDHTFVAVKEGYFDIKLKVINPNGCPEYATKRIWIVNNSQANSFTPNGDGINDRFMPGWYLKVYNRNGLLLYEGNDGWDGKYKGKLVSQDTYFYIMNYATETGTKTKEGFVMVIR
jgi:large repetitive protein